MKSHRVYRGYYIKENHGVGRPYGKYSIAKVGTSAWRFTNTPETLIDTLISMG